MKTGNGTFIGQDLEQWAANHETSAEIALAIDEMSGNNREELWQNPTDVQIEQILIRAWELAGKKTTLYWGLNTIKNGATNID